MSTIISVRLNEATVKLLDSVAKETDRARSFHLQKAVIAYLEEFADAQIALDRLRNNMDDILPALNMRQRLGLSDNI
jgi:RHH-type rel operon transcriptional repressor/antitoxin RelB